MSFSKHIRLSEEHHSLDGPVYHILPYITGGLDRLLHRIKTQSVPELADYGYHTNKDGHFEPVGECLMGLRYLVKQKLDTKGHSAVLVLAEDLFDHKKLIVIKVLHSQFYQLGSQESHILWKLAVADPLNHSHTLRLLTTLTFDSHFCLVFEPLLPEPLTSIFQEFPTNRVLPNLRKVGLRLLATIGFLHQQNMIHTDLKPENILLKHESDLDSVHVVDFGNTIHYVHKEVSLYYKDFELQTPLYRAPEVMFGLPFGTEIDMWSLGCILAELYTGEPLFYGRNKEEILTEIQKLLGPLPSAIFKRGKFFQELKRYTSAEEKKVQATRVLMDHLKCRDVAFAELLAGLLQYNPDERLTAREAACRPFFASHFPLGFLIGDTLGTACPSHHISKKGYCYSPEISSSIQKRQPSSVDLLKMGTTEASPVEYSINIVRPKPIELLNERRKMHEKKPLKVNRVPDDKPGDPVADNIYFDALLEAKKEAKFSDNVKEKMSSLLQAIRQEQDLVEIDLEKKSEEATVKKGSFRISSDHSRFHRDGEVESRSDREVHNDHVSKHKLLSPTLAKPNKIVTPDIVKHAMHIKNQTVGDIQTNKSDANQEPLFSPTYKTGNFKNDQYKMPEIHEVKENKRFHDKKQTGNRRNKVLNDKVGTDKQIHMSLHDDKVTPVHLAKPKVTPESSYKESDDEDVDHKQFIRTTPTLVFAKHKSDSDSNKFRACDWNSARKSNDGKIVSPVKSGHDATAAFEKIYSDAVTPKHAKTTPEASFEDEYVNIISPYDPSSGSKRKRNSKPRKHMVDSTQKIATPKYLELVGSKVAVNADNKTQQLKSFSADFINSSHDLETDNFSHDEQIGANAESGISCSSEEVYSEKKHRHFGDENIDSTQEDLTASSHDSARRKCYEKAFSKSRNMKNEEIKFNRYNLHVRKKNCNSEKQPSQNLTNASSFSLNKSHNSINDSNNVKESASHSANCNMLERNNSDIIQDQRQENRQMDRVSLYSNDKSMIQCKGYSTKVKKCAEADRVLATRNKKSSEKYLTPISKSDDYQVIAINGAGSPEIIYKAETYSPKQKEGEFKGQTVVENHRKSEKYMFLKKMPRNWKESKVDGDDRYKSRKHATDDNDQIVGAGKAGNKYRNNFHSLDSDKLLKSTGKREANQMQADPYNFGCSPATDVKKKSVGGIGERIQEKRNKVKKKARKSLVFQPNMDQNYTDSDQDNSEFSQADLGMSDEEAHDCSNDKHFVEPDNRRKSQDKAIHAHHSATQKRQTVNVANNDMKPQERKRITTTESDIPSKKQKVENIPAKLSNEVLVVRKVMKKSKLVKAFDTTYTIDFESPQHSHDRNSFN